MSESATRVLVVAGQHPDIVPGESQQAAYELFAALRSSPEHVPVFMGGVRADLHPHLVRADIPVRAYAGRDDEYLLGVPGLDGFTLGWPAPRADFWATVTRSMAALAPDAVLFSGIAALGAEFLRAIRNACPAARILVVLDDFSLICPAGGAMVRTHGRGLCGHATPARWALGFPDRTPAEISLRARWLQAQLACADHFVATSGFLRDRFVDWGLAPERIAVIRPALPEPAGPVRREPASAARNRFGLFGALTEETGLGMALDAAEALIAQGRTDFELVLHGDARLAPDALQRRLAEMAALPQIRRPAFTGEALPEAAIGLADWVLAPSLWWESAPRSVEAAFRAGRPVLCSDEGGLAERVADGVAGLHFPLGDARALAALMARCLAEPALWDRLAAGIPAVPSLADQVPAYAALWSARPVVNRQPEPAAQARRPPGRRRPG